MPFEESIREFYSILFVRSDGSIGVDRAGREVNLNASPVFNVGCSSVIGSIYIKNILGGERL